MLLVSLAALLATPAAVADPPALSGVPGDQLLEATSPAGAAFSWADPTALDDGTTSVPVTCVPPSGTTFPIATTTVTCTAVDPDTLEESSQPFDVKVEDTTAPTLSLPDNITAEATGASGAAVSYSASATDIVDGDISPNCSPASGSTFPLGTTTVNCSAADTRSNSTSGSFTVTVQDTTAPSLTLPGDISVPATGPSGASVSFTVTASDLVDATPTVNCSPASGSTFPLGVTTVNCTATDDASNSAPGSFSVTVTDTTPPSLTLPGNMIVPATGPSGAVVTFTVTASDLIDTTPTVVCSPPSGSTFPLGTTTVNCTATDDSNNSAPGSFTVTVQDTIAPTLTVPGNTTLEATGASGATVTYTATATDAVDTTPTVNCSPPSGSVFPIATTTVSCTATDDSGNTSAAKTFDVAVRDTTPPAVTVPADFGLEATGPNGAPATFSASAADIVDGTITPACTPASGSTFPLGATTVSCTATDARSNSSTSTFKISVRDTTAPVLGLIPDRTVEADGPLGSRVAYTAPSAVDIVNGPVLVSCTPDSGTVFALGTTIVTCSARDTVGNVGTASFAIKVVDTTKPTLNAPQPQEVSARGAPTLPRSDAQIVAFLNAASAQDLVDGPVLVTNDASEELPLGTTRVTFTATDRAGNTAVAQAALTVVTGTARPQVQDTTPPKDVTRLKAKPADRSVRLTWVPPKADFDHVTVTRSPGRSGAPSAVVYTGKAKELKDGNLTNGVEYRYAVAAVDKVGNASRGVVARAVPLRPLLYAPLQGAVVTRPPTLRWAAVGGATYYNVQLYRARAGTGTQPGTKILSEWPAKPQYALKRTWKYLGRAQRLTPGRYVWYAWAGFGAKSANRYGPVLGQSTFTVK